MTTQSETVTPVVQVEQVGCRWVARCSYEQREIPKAAGFRWDPKAKQWYTTDPGLAAALADPESLAKLQAGLAEKQAVRAVAIEASRAADADVELPCPDGFAYLPYQRAGIAAALRRGSVLFGDEMGLGKTIQAIGILNADPTLRKVLVICPASLRLNWRNEMRRWLTRDMTMQIVTGPSCHPDFSDVLIINYDNLDKHKKKLRAVAWDALIVDEAHYLKNPDAKRTQAVLGKETKGVVEEAGIQARRRIALTGTPIPNRPIEGWPIFHYLDPGEFPKFFPYAIRYCNANNSSGHWDFSGSSHLSELQEKLRASIMIRRLKADVLKELPAKRRAIIEIPANGAAGIIEVEAAAWEEQQERLAILRAAVELAKASEDPEDYADAAAALRQAAQASFTEMAQIRKNTAIAKIPYVIDHIRDSIENGKVIVFAHHHEVVEAIAAEFKSECVTIYGPTPMAAREVNKERFQTDPTCKIIVGSFGAMGVGWTLTASSHVIAAELDWVPGNMTQAEDRAHRIGQTEMVLVQHLVLEGSLDARMAAVLVAKQEVIAAALDNKVEEPVLPVAEKERAATESVTRKKIDEEAAAMSSGRISAIHRGLQMLAGRCDGAESMDGAGFSKVDVRIGHSLADEWELTPRQAALGAKLVNKYRRQLPPDLVSISAGVL